MLKVINSGLLQVVNFYMVKNSSILLPKMRKRSWIN